MENHVSNPITVLCGMVWVAMSAILSGCAEPDDPHTAFDEQTDTLAQVQATVDAYVRALKEADTEALSGLVSEELATRITTRAHADTFEQKLKIFAEHEGRKLVRELGPTDATVGVTAVSPVADGTGVAVTLSIHGQEVPKPLHLVLEDGQYKVGVQHAAPLPLEPRSSSVYLVQNNDYWWRWFTCSGASQWWQISPYPAAMLMACNDSCSWFFDGTRFFTTLGAADCDYNTWGVDMYIQNNYPVCTDPC